MSSKKYATFVNEKLHLEAAVKSTAPDHNWLHVKTDSIGRSGNAVKQLEKSFIPAVVYWSWKSAIECEIDQAVTVGYLENSIHHAADSLGLSEKLAGRKLVITLKSVPGKFLYQSAGHVLFLFFAYSYSAGEVILPVETTLVANFEIHDGSEIIEGGDIVIRRGEEPVSNIWKTTKKLTGFYLDKNRKDTESMGVELVQEIAQKLNGDLLSRNK